MEGGGGFGMKTFFLSLVFNPDLEGKITLHLSKNCLFPQSAQHAGAGPTTSTVLTKPTKSARSNKLTAFIMPIFLSFFARSACSPYLQCLKTLPACLYYKQKTTSKLKLCCGT